MSDIFDTIEYKEQKGDIFDKVAGKWGVSDTLRGVGATLGSFAAMPISGLVGLEELIRTRDIGKTEKAMNYVSSLPQKLLNTERQKQAVENVGRVATWPFQKVGAGYAGLTELASTGDLQKAVDVIRGESVGSNWAVPTLKVLGEAAAMGAAGGLGKRKGKQSKVEELIKEEPKVTASQDIFDVVAKETIIEKPKLVEVPQEKIPIEVKPTEPIIVEAKSAVIETPIVTAAKPTNTTTIYKRIKELGGIDSASLKEYSTDPFSEGLGGWTRKGGRRVDDIAKTLQEEGYLPPTPEGYSGPADWLVDWKRQKRTEQTGKIIDNLTDEAMQAKIEIERELRDAGYNTEQIAAEFGKVEGDIAKEVSLRRTQDKLDEVNKIIDEDFPEEIETPLNELPGTPQTFSLSGNQPIESKTFVKPELKGERMFDVPKQTVDELYNRMSGKDLVSSHEAFVKGGRIGDLPKYAEGSSINLERLNTTQDVKQLLNGLTQRNEAAIGKRKISWEETREAAKELGWNEKEFLKTAKEKKGFSAAEIDAMRQIHGNAIEDLHRALRGIPADSSLRTDAMKMAVLDKINNYIQVAKETSAKSSEAGRALNIHKKLITEDPEFINAKKVFDALDGKKITDGLINDLSKLDFKDTAKVKEVIRKHWSGKVHDMFFEAWLNAILSGPQTHATNILSNTITALTKIPETAIGSTLAGRNPFKEVRAETIGIWNGMKEGTRAALKAFKTGEPSELWGKVDINITPAIKGIKGEVVRTPTKALTAADEFFKSVVYRAELNRLAYVKSKGKPSKMSEYMANPTEDMLIAAHKEVLYRTFNKPLGKFGNHIMMIRNEIPGLKYAVPFVRTPANIAKYALERTPANFAKLVYDYKKGKITGEQLRTEMAKPILGTAIQVAIYEWTKEGYITGGGPKEPSKREALYRTGWQPYSIKIGDTYYPYNRLEPVGSVVGMAADFAEIINRKEDRTTNKLAGEIATSFGKNITSKTFLSGIINMMDAISDPQRYGENWINQLSGSVVPSFVGAINKSQDPQMYRTETPADIVKAKAGMTKDMYPKRDIWGEPIQRAGTPTQRLISPIVTSKAKNDYINDELVRLDIHPSPVSKSIRNVKLRPDEYDRYAELSGKLARQKVSAYMNSVEYSMIRDDVKKITIAKLMQASRAQAASEILFGMEENRKMEPIRRKYGIGGLE